MYVQDQVEFSTLVTYTFTEIFEKDTILSQTSFEIRWLRASKKYIQIFWDLKMTEIRLRTGHMSHVSHYARMTSILYCLHNFNENVCPIFFSHQIYTAAADRQMQQGVSALQSQFYYNGDSKLLS